MPFREVTRRKPNGWLWDCPGCGCENEVLDMDGGIGKCRRCQELSHVLPEQPTPPPSTVAEIKRRGENYRRAEEDVIRLTAEVSRLTRELSQERIEWMLVNDANDQLRQERDKGV